jgi:hypothetical protein
VVTKNPSAAEPRPARQARDEDNNPRLSGGDAFAISLLREAGSGEGGAAGAAAAGRALRVVAEGKVSDRGDGSHEASYLLREAGRYLLAVTDGGLVVLVGLLGFLFACWLVCLFVGLLVCWLVCCFVDW